MISIFGRTSRYSSNLASLSKQYRCAITININSFRTFATTATKDSAIPEAQLTTNDELTSIVNQFPPQDYAFGYGSGVLRQQSTAANRGMIDIIFAVDNPHTWHEHNLQKNSYHYSYMARMVGVNFITWLQKNFGAKIYFHPFVDINLQLNSDTIQRQVKYGVVSTDDLIQDLLNWEYLYLAGRMHKPIVSIDLKSNDALRQRNDRADGIEEAQRINLLSAVSASLLLYNNNTIPTSQLYNTIASLSYTGDFRMQTGAEDPNKVKKLVETPGMLDLWDDKYSDTLDKLQKMGLISVANGSKDIETNLSDVAIRKQLVQHLPSRLRKHSDSIVGSSSNIGNQGTTILRQELANIVSPAAKSQSIKGFFTAGVVKSWRYALAKLKKGRIK